MIYSQKLSDSDIVYVASRVLILLIRIIVRMIILFADPHDWLA
jgi:hypothetical protein